MKYCMMFIRNLNAITYNTQTEPNNSLMHQHWHADKDQRFAPKQNFDICLTYMLRIERDHLDVGSSKLEVSHAIYSLIWKVNKQLSHS